MKSTFYSTVIPLIANRIVLDVGSIGHSYSGRDGYKTWNFAVLREHAASIRGFDLASLAGDINQARADGFQIEIGDAETYRISNKVQVVFAGDVIEHLSNRVRLS